MNKKFKLIIIAAIIIIGSMFLKIYNDNRIKTLDQVFYYNPKNFRGFGIASDQSLLQDDGPYEFYTVDEKPVEELLEFLSNYKVKKVKEEYILDHWNDIEKLRIDIFNTKRKQSMVYISENHIYALMNDDYVLINGPIDMDWLHNFQREHIEK